MSQTPNHDYNVPAKGTTNWHNPLNENFRRLDTHVEIRGVDSNKSNYGPDQGAQFLALDTGIVYQGLGSSWVSRLAMYRFTDPSTTGAAGNVVAGHEANGVDSGVSGGTISGGGFATEELGERNRVSGDFGTVGGGRDNEARGEDGTVGGGAHNEADGTGATVGGGLFNAANADYATVAGGASLFMDRPIETRNIVHDMWGTVGGGAANVAGTPGDPNAPWATVAGGRRNEATRSWTTVAGGDRNEATEDHATVGGGQINQADGKQSTVVGGVSNLAAGRNATVAGGADNRAKGNVSWAAGHNAHADGDGTFVWGDSSDEGVTATQTDEFKVQAGGGAVIFSASDHSAGVNLAPGSGSWSSWSSREGKANVEPVDTADALEGVRNMEVATWNYASQDESIRHMGPMAEDFYDEFGLGGDRERIAGVDADGVAFGAIQALAEELDTRDARIDELETENAAIRERLSALEERIDAMESGSTASEHV